MNNQINRTYYFDYLRIAATFAVIVLHVSAQSIYTPAVGSLKWDILNIYDSCVRWSVPIFVMISGSLFLEKDISIKDLFFKKILRIVTAFCTWSSIYVIYRIFTDEIELKPVAILSKLIKGEYHLWFCFMIVGLYLIVPFLKKIISDKNLTIYFIILSFLFIVLKPEILRIISIVSENLANQINKTLNQTYLYFVCGFTIYFIGGYFINKIDIKKVWRIILYILGIIGIVITAYFTLRASLKAGTIVTTHYENMTINVFFTSIALFVFAKYNLNFAFKNDKINHFVRLISKYSFGAYLVHILIMYILRDNSFTALSFNPIIGVPIVSIIIFVISLCISAIINNIPFLKKYIV